MPMISLSRFAPKLRIAGMVEKQANFELGIFGFAPVRQKVQPYQGRAQSWRRASAPTKKGKKFRKIAGLNRELRKSPRD